MRATLAYGVHATPVVVLPHMHANTHPFGVEHFSATWAGSAPIHASFFDNSQSSARTILRHDSPAGQLMHCPDAEHGTWPSVVPPEIALKSRNSG